MTFDPTPEQEQAIAVFRDRKDLAIEAGAGTGKTATLQLLAESTARRGQYVAFNKSIVTESKSRMPENVKARTAHSLAFAAVGRHYGHRLKNSQRIKSKEIAQILRINPEWIRYGEEAKVLQAGYLAGWVMRGVSNFCQTADLEPDVNHFPYIKGIDLPKSPGVNGWDNNNEIRQRLLPALKAAWADVQRKDGALSFKHDHYLKMWHLSGPKIGSDFILFDEAQDANPVLLAIVYLQTHAQKVFVGDSCQQIYAFTGAINALDRIVERGAERTFLTQSFRFGPAIAKLANRVLGWLEADLRIRGSQVIMSSVQPVKDPHAILTRTNATAVSTLLRHQMRGRKVHLLGGGGEVLEFAKAAGELKLGRFTMHPDLACFSTWGQVQEYVSQDELGNELAMLVKLIDEFGVDQIIGALDPMIPEDQADLTVSTAHKAKGREWETVRLGEDFPEPDDSVTDEEYRLMYVAVTRARHVLDISRCPLLLEPDPETLDMRLLV